MPQILERNSSQTKSRALVEWVAEIAPSSYTPISISWCDGSEAERRRLTESRGEIRHPDPAQPRRNARMLPASLQSQRRRAHRATHLHMHARQRKTPARPTTGADPAETYAKMRGWFAGSMRGRTMYVIPYVMGPLGSPLVEGRRRDHRQHLRRAQHAHHDAHGRAGARAARRDPTTSTAVSIARSISIPSGGSSAIFRRTTRSGRSASGYGGNALLSKKCFALRIASCTARRRRLARRAHADPRRSGSQGRDHLHRRGVSERMRQDQPRDAAAAARASPGGKSSPSATTSRGCASARRPAVGGQSRERVLRRRSRHQFDKSNPTR